MRVEKVDRIVLWGYILTHAATCAMIGAVYSPGWGVVAFGLPSMAEIYLLVMGLMGNPMHAVPALAFMAVIPFGIGAGMWKERGRSPRNHRHHLFGGRWAHR